MAGAADAPESSGARKFSLRPLRLRNNSQSTMNAILPLFVRWDVNPTMISIGSFEIRYYGLMWALALGISAYIFSRIIKREDTRQAVRLDLLVRRAVDDHRRPTRALPVLRSGILSDPSRRDPLHSSGRTGQPRRGRRSARRSVAFFAQEQNALHLVARPHRDRCRHRRRARPGSAT